MRIKEHKEIKAAEVLKQLQLDYSKGNVDAWELVKFKIDSIPRIDYHMELFFKTMMKQHLGID